MLSANSLSAYVNGAQEWARNASGHATYIHFDWCDVQFPDSLNGYNLAHLIL